MPTESRFSLSGSLRLTIITQVICLVFGALILDTGVMQHGFLYASIMYWAYITVIAIVRRSQKQSFETPGFIYQVRYLYFFFLPLGYTASLLLGSYSQF